MRRKIAILVSAIILSIQLGSPIVAAAATEDQLAEISALVAENDVAALRAYLQAHPELLTEKTKLADLLQEFMEKSVDMVSFGGLWQGLAAAIGAEAKAASISFAEFASVQY